MSSNATSDKMQTTGTVLSWLTGLTFIGMLTFVVAFIRSNTGSGIHTISGVAPYLSFVILAAEAVALVLLVVGVACWPSRIIRSPRWVISAIGIVFVAVAIAAVLFLAATIAVQNP